jgi:hypothetical protein
MKDFQGQRVRPPIAVGRADTGRNVGGESGALVKGTFRFFGFRGHVFSNLLNVSRASNRPRFGHSEAGAGMRPKYFFPFAAIGAAYAIANPFETRRRRLRSGRFPCSAATALPTRNRSAGPEFNVAGFGTSGGS